jgi:hypothetical protein
MESNAKPNQSFTKEDLLDGKMQGNGFQIDYLPMWHFLDNMEKKVPGGLKSLNLKRVLEGVYEFGVIQVGLEKAEMQMRVDNLNEQNLKWFTKADLLEKEVELLRQKLQEKQTTNEN